VELVFALIASGNYSNGEVSRQDSNPERMSNSMKVSDSPKCWCRTKHWVGQSLVQNWYCDRRAGASNKIVVSTPPSLRKPGRRASSSDSVHNSPLTILFETSSGSLTPFPHDVS
jgi:hypothetical protein